MNSHKTPDIAIWMVTYNHGSYIEQAIDSIVNQKAKCTFKLYIGEDASSDNTREICLRMKEKYPNAIELTLHNKNIGATANGTYMYDVCMQSGAKYIAMCEGDDYWTDDHKLQKQFEILEADPTLSSCFHTAKMIDEESGRFDLLPNYLSDRIIYTEQLLDGNNPIATSSVLYRNQSYIDLPEDIPYRDYYLHIINSMHGGIYYIHQIMSVYRRHQGGIYSLQVKSTSGLITIKKMNYRFWGMVGQRLSLKNTQIDNTRRKLLKQIIKLSFQSGNYFNFILFLLKYIIDFPVVLMKIPSKIVAKLRG